MFDLKLKVSHCDLYSWFLDFPLNLEDYVSDISFLFLAHLSRRLRESLSYRQAPSSVRRPSVRRSSTIINDFSETAGPIATKFHIQPPGTLGKKNFPNGLGHMTNMAAMPIYGKNLKKSSSPKPIDQ